MGVKDFRVSRVSTVSKVSRVSRALRVFARYQGKGTRRSILAYLHSTIHLHPILYFEALRVINLLYVLTLHDDASTVSTGCTAEGRA